MTPARAARRVRPRAGGVVVALVARRIERALAARTRYKYVRPRVEAEGAGWKIVSPNCSRNIDPDGGEIDIAWFVPAAGARWDLHARDHAAAAWRLTAAGVTLDDALARVCADAAREYWR